MVMEEKNNIIVSFYQNNQDIFHAVSRKSENILQSLTAKYLTYMPTKRKSFLDFKTRNEEDEE